LFELPVFVRQYWLVVEGRAGDAQGASSSTLVGLD
jgi:hypothetical protein